MALKMSEGSLFAVLLRSPWWYSALIGLFILTISLTMWSGQIAILVISLSIPFFGIAGYAAYLQSGQPSQKKILEVDQQARNMRADEIAAKIAENYTSQRFDCTQYAGAVAELELERGNRKLLVSSKRFKAANTGIEPLVKLVEAGKKEEVTEYLYVALGNVSANARKFATENNVELVGADRLAEFFEQKAKI